MVTIRYNLFRQAMQFKNVIKQKFNHELRKRSTFTKT